jgi:hypothetical protein
LALDWAENIAMLGFAFALARATTVSAAFLAMLKLAAIRLWLRHKESTA